MAAQCNGRNTNLRSSTIRLYNNKKAEFSPLFPFSIPHSSYCAIVRITSTSNQEILKLERIVSQNAASLQCKLCHNTYATTVCPCNLHSALLKLAHCRKQKWLNFTVQSSAHTMLPLCVLAFQARTPPCGIEKTTRVAHGPSERGASDSPAAICK